MDMPDQPNCLAQIDSKEIAVIRGVVAFIPQRVQRLIGRDDIILHVSADKKRIEFYPKAGYVSP